MDIVPSLSLSGFHELRKGVRYTLISLSHSPPSLSLSLSLSLDFMNYQCAIALQKRSKVH